MITGYSNTVSVTTLPETGLLGDYPGAAAAYSLRQLRSQYLGPAVEVRNDGGVHLDIGFDENGDLDTAALLAHCGSGDGTVSKWYDQSGDSRDASQTTVANQPQIVSSGSVITENGKPAVEFDGNDVLILSIISYTNISTIAVAKTTSIPSSNAHVVVQSVGVLLKSGQNQNNYPRFQPYDSGYKTAEYQVDSENQQLLLFGYTSSGNAYIYVNNNVGTSASISTLQSPANPFHIGLFPTVPNTSNNGPIQEVIIYPSDQSSNRSGIETNINSHYNIYYVSPDADAQAFFDRVDTAGGTLTSTEEDAIGKLVFDLKAAGIWSKMKAIYPMVGASAAACSQNLKSSSYTLSFAGGWTFSSTGVLGNGTNNTATTGYVQTNFLFGLSIYNRTNSNKLAYDIGQQDSVAASWTHILLGLNSTSMRARNATNGNIDYNYSSTNVGFWQTNRISTSTNGWNVNYNGSVVAQNSNFGNTLPTAAVILGGNAGIYPDREYAFASMHDGLSNTEASDFYDAVQAFNTTLSRNV